MQGRKAIINIRGVTKRFGADVVAVDDVNLDIQEGEFFALLGPSGCGKTTLLRMMAGFEVPTDGEIVIDGDDMAGVPANKRPINMVFQSYAVFPHMSVQDNVAYGLKVTGVDRAEYEPRVAEALELVQLGGFGERMPDQLSGGQRQRVALARALVKRPRVLLLDEPLSALDAKLREAMQLELVRLQETVGITFVIVTHDQNEALSMADRIAVMESGRVSQLAPPAELYEHPANRFVADFIGKVNIFEGEVRDGASGANGETRVACAETGGDLLVAEAPQCEAGRQVWVAVRPEKIGLSREAPDQADNCAEGVVNEIAYFGDQSIYYVELDSGKALRVTSTNLTRGAAGAAGAGAGDISYDERVYVHWQPSGGVLLLS